MIKYRPGRAITYKYCFLTIAGISAVLLSLFAIGNYPDVVERCYSLGFYRLISTVWHFLLGWIPFSTGDVFYTAVIISILYYGWQLLRKLATKQSKLLGLSLLKLVISLQLFIAGFYLLWGLNYFRPPAARVLSLPDSPYTLTDLQAITTLLIDSANTSRAALPGNALTTGNARIYQSAVQAIKHAGTMHPALKSFYPSAKPALFTPIINYFGTAGYFNPFSGEAQVNYAMPVVDKPFTACHEMAHQIGFAREDEANFIGFIAGIQSADRLMRYSAYYAAMQEFMRQVHQRDSLSYKDLKLKLSAQVKADLKAERQYWHHYQSRVSRISSMFYDQFLKANNQPEGLETYNRMINLTVAYYRKTNLLPRHNP